ncbi:nucleolin [Stomoxys calcitrans]|uniref:nucleolin n=1 Tax=Stomoxys calcitrans TaxID=35570 RepID=UPI0027E36DB3|nr:nucleolin [Stomoxys calcitrans]
MKRKNLNKINDVVENSDSDVSEENQSESENDESANIEEEEDTDVDLAASDTSSSEDEEAEEEESVEPKTKSEDTDEDLAASDTSSSEDEEAEEEESDEPKTQSDIIKENVLQRYEERQGKQLFIRFPHKIPDTEEGLEKMAKDLSPLINKVHKPRQKHARFCLVDFNNKEDRDAAFKALRESIQKGELVKHVVNIPRTESKEYINQLAERKIKSVENKRAKARLKKASKKALIQKIFTPTVVVLNLPKTVSILQIRELFPNAVDIQIKPGKGKLNKDKSIASVTLPSTMEARKAVKQKMSISGNELVVKFDNHLLKKNLKTKKSKNSKLPTVEQTEKAEEDEPKPKKAKRVVTEDNSEKDEESSLHNNSSLKINKTIKQKNKKNKSNK